MFHIDHMGPFEIDPEEPIVQEMKAAHEKVTGESPNVPVINPILAGIKLTELMGDMYKNMNVSHSKIYDYQNKIEKLNY